MNSHFFSQISNNILILTANRRLTESIRHDYDQQQIKNGLGVWPSLEIMPLNSWLLKLWQDCPAHNEQILSEFQEHYHWQQIIQQTQKNLYPLLQVEQTAVLVSQAWQLAQNWQVSLATLKKTAQTQETHALIDWAEQFIHLCQCHQWRSQAEIPQRLLELLPHHTWPIWPEHIVIAGFDELPPVHLQLIELLKKYTRVSVRGGENLPGLCRSGTFADFYDEIEAMAQWAKSYQQQHPQHSIGCVVPQLNQHRSRVAHIFQQTFAIENQLPGMAPTALMYNISAGQNLHRFTMIDIGLRALGLGLDQLNVENSSDLLQSLYLCQNESDISLGALLDVELRQANCFALPLSAIFTAISQWQSHYPHNTWLKRWREFLELLPVSPKNQLPSLWVRDFINQLQALGWPGGRALNSLEHQLINRWQDLLLELAELDAITGSISHVTAYQLLRQLAARTVFQPKSSLNTSIQILGTLESSGLYFDALWISGLDDQNWPPPAQPNPFLPYELQMQLQMPHANSQRELRYTQQITHRLLRSAKQIWLSCSPSQVDQPVRFSTLLSTNLENFSAISAGPHFAQTIFLSSLKQTLFDNTAPPILISEKIYGGSAILTKQAECPFSAFASFRLNAKPLPKLSLGITASERGILLHHCLEKIWQSVHNQKNLQALSVAELLQLITHVVDATIEEFLQASPARHRWHETPFLQIERDRLISLIMDWLDIEKMRPPFATIAREAQFSVEISSLKLQLKIDRIDELSDGSLMLIDYKTGLAQVKSWFGDRLQQPQLPLYAVYADEGQRFSALAFAQVRAGKLTFNGLHIESPNNEPIFPVGLKAIDAYKDVDAPKSWQELLLHWRQGLEKLASEFVNGYAAVDPVEQGIPCQNCDLQTLCRVNDSKSLMED